jgi:hypothetical protein
VTRRDAILVAANTMCAIAFSSTGSFICVRQGIITQIVPGPRVDDAISLAGCAPSPRVDRQPDSPREVE